MANDWASLSEVLDRYRDAGGNAPGSVDDDFDRVAQNAPPEALRDGVAEAFRSDRTPEFPQMAAQMFGRASGPQRSQILGMLLSTVGPMVLQQILARRGQAGGGSNAQVPGGGGMPGGGGLGDILGGMLGGRQGGGAPAGGGGGGLGDILGGMLGRGGSPQVPPEAAEKVDPSVVEDLAREAQKQDPSVLERMSDVVAGQPQLLKVIGGAALAIALGRMASKRNTL